MRRSIFLCSLTVWNKAACWSSLQQTGFGAQYAEISARLDVVSTQMGTSVVEIVNNEANPSPHEVLGRIWHKPISTGDNGGLGGGITYAWDPGFCSAMLPAFSEDIWTVKLVKCDDLRQAWHRALNAWSSNHRYINYIDVTDACLVQLTCSATVVQQFLCCSRSVPFSHVHTGTSRATGPR